MNTHIKGMITRVASITGLALGAFALSAAAQTAWVGNNSTPPQNNAFAPINVSAAHQAKTGSLSLNTNLSNPDMYGLDVFGISRFFGNVEIGTQSIPGKIKIVDGSQGDGKVLTSDATGLATWKVLPVTPGGGGNTGDGVGSTVTLSTTFSADNQQEVNMGTASQWSACFLVAAGTVVGNGDNASFCNINRNTSGFGPGWTLKATSGAGEATHCEAQCILIR